MSLKCKHSPQSPKTREKGKEAFQKYKLLKKFSCLDYCLLKTNANQLHFYSDALQKYSCKNASSSRFMKNTRIQVSTNLKGIKLNWVPPQYPPIQSIRVQFTRCDNEKGFIITSPSKYETMKVQDNAIIIRCDGFYLISLKGYFSQELSLSLHYRKGREPLFSLSKVKSVNSIAVPYLAFKDKVYLNVTTDDTSCEDIQVNGGELILIHQNPGGFCAY
ncbi:tumor necrosis factor ligand superfamily member 4 isoform X1 [Manis pentadactyla]|uniref:tumor necrosis factor ligand superfamily member 4 isoform X1 n=1 Tax=Manis pentadactyla TaxID=143292 RepID=UPI001877491A|nr:tumor necrosis factor ligand superfamily member 4 isoform X1 [Manis pentadactyla]